MRLDLVVAAFLLPAALTVSSAWPSPALAAEGVRTDYFLLYPSLKMSETWESNIFQTAEDEVGDFISYVQPAVRLQLPYRHHLLQLEGEAAFVRYAEESGEDNDIWKAEVSLGGNYPSGISFLLGDRMSRQWIQSQFGFTVAEYVDFSQFYGNAAYAAHDDFKVEAQVYRYTYAYRVTDDLDRAENIFSLTFFYRVFPKTSALVEFDWSGIAYDKSLFHYKDNAVWQARAGLKWAATGKTTGEIRAGWQRKNYREAALEDVDTLVVTGLVSYAFSRSTILEVEMQRGTLESDFTNNPYYTTSSLRADLSHHLTGKIKAAAGLSLRYDAYPNQASVDGESARRSDRLVTGSLKLAFQVLRWLGVGMEASQDRRDSNLDRFRYQDTRVTLSATAAF